jgi:DNA polymerase I-like protein with 3'-5' exonuclease and polymerase domains
MFGLIYGAGVSKLSETSGLHKDVCERFISGFYHRYGRVKWYHDNIAEVADASGKHTGERDQAGHPIRTFLHRSNTGRVYHFHEYEIPWKAGTYGFSPTELKNRPVQGWATADIVPLAIGLLYRYNACKSTPAHLLNTVHDSVLVACRTEFDAVEWAVEAKIILESVQREYEEAYSTALPLPFKVASSIGKNWLDMKPYPYEED